MAAERHPVLHCFVTGRSEVDFRRKLIFHLLGLQIGFVSAYTIFVAQNLQAFVLAVSHCKTYIPLQIMIFGQLIIFLRAYPLGSVCVLMKK
jgi:hypothetical protein